MTPDDYKQTYEDYSSRASALVRQCAFAGIATAWLFKSEHTGNEGIPDAIVTSVIWFLLALIFEFAQYTLGTIIYRILLYRCEAQVLHDSEPSPCTHSKVWPGLIAVCFALKLLCVWIGWVNLIGYASRQVL